MAEENSSKNRFDNTGLVPNSSRVKLAKSRRKDKYSDYVIFDDNFVFIFEFYYFFVFKINACFVDGIHCKNEYILAQAPLEHTVVDFWKMIWQCNVEVIVCLTTRFEGDSEKCALYWPESRRSTSKQFGNFDVDLFQIDLEETYFVRTMRVKNLNVRLCYID